MEKMKTRFPERAISKEEILKDVFSKKENDIDWKKGRSFCLIYYAGEEKSKSIKQVFDLFYYDNALNPTAAPSLPAIESETINMCIDLFHGDEKVRGNISSGGTESILLAVKTSRDYARKHHPGKKKPHVVVPSSVHPAFIKAFHCFGLEYTAVKIRNDFRADPVAMRAAITPDTVLMVGSAPAYPHGVMDPIEELAEIAREKKILFHVDACIGGFMLPFLKRAGYNIPHFDFLVDGVTSLSADLHKYGYSPKGASVILYKNAEIRKHQFSVYTGWNGGIYGSPTLLGTRAGSSIAGAWAALKTIGMEGYVKMAKETMETTVKIRKAIEETDGIDLMGNPEMTILAFSSSTLDVFVIADELNKRGWHFERQQLPPSIHLTINHIHCNAADEFIADLKLSVEAAKKFSLQKISNRIQAGMVKGLSKILPEGTIAKIQSGKDEKMDAKGGDKAAMYGMMGALQGTSDLNEIVVDFLDKTYS